MKLSDFQATMLMRVLRGALNVRTDVLFGYDHTTLNKLYNEIINQQDHTLVDLEQASTKESP